MALYAVCGLFKYIFNKKDSALMVIVWRDGLPVSISSSAVASLGSCPRAFFNFILWIGLAVMLTGILRSIGKQESEKTPEAWMRLLYTIGLVILAVTPWLPGIWQATGNGIDPFNWQSIAVFIISISIIFVFIIKSQRILHEIGSCSDP